MDFIFRLTVVSCLYLLCITWSNGHVKQLEHKLCLNYCLTLRGICGWGRVCRFNQSTCEGKCVCTNGMLGSACNIPPYQRTSKITLWPNKKPDTDSKANTSNSKSKRLIDFGSASVEHVTDAKTNIIPTSLVLESSTYLSDAFNNPASDRRIIADGNCSVFITTEPKSDTTILFNMNNSDSFRENASQNTSSDSLIDNVKTLVTLEFPLSPNFVSDDSPSVLLENLTDTTPTLRNSTESYNITISDSSLQKPNSPRHETILFDANLLNRTKKTEESFNSGHLPETTSPIHSLSVNQDGVPSIQPTRILRETNTFFYSSKNLTAPAHVDDTESSAENFIGETSLVQRKIESGNVPKTLLASNLETTTSSKIMSILDKMETSLLSKLLIRSMNIESAKMPSTHSESILKKYSNLLSTSESTMISEILPSKSTAFDYLIEKLSASDENILESRESFKQMTDQFSHVDSSNLNFSPSTMSSFRGEDSSSTNQSLKTPDSGEVRQRQFRSVSQFSPSVATLKTETVKPYKNDAYLTLYNLKTETPTIPLYSKLTIVSKKSEIHPTTIRPRDYRRITVDLSEDFTSTELPFTKYKRELTNVSSIESYDTNKFNSRVTLLPASKETLYSHSNNEPSTNQNTTPSSIYAYKSLVPNLDIASVANFSDMLVSRIPNVSNTFIEYLIFRNIHNISKRASTSPNVYNTSDFNDSLSINVSKTNNSMLSSVVNTSISAYADDLSINDNLNNFLSTKKIRNTVNQSLINISHKSRNHKSSLLPHLYNTPVSSTFNTSDTSTTSVDFLFELNNTTTRVSHNSSVFFRAVTTNYSSRRVPIIFEENKRKLNKYWHNIFVTYSKNESKFKIEPREKNLTIDNTISYSQRVSFINKSSIVHNDSYSRSLGNVNFDKLRSKFMEQNKIETYDVDNFMNSVSKAIRLPYRTQSINNTLRHSNNNSTQRMSRSFQVSDNKKSARFSKNSLSLTPKFMTGIKTTIIPDT